jgi:hypothetical protein
MGDTPPQNGSCIDPPGIYTDTFENKADPFSRYLYGYLGFRPPKVLLLAA